VSNESHEIKTEKKEATKIPSQKPASPHPALREMQLVSFGERVTLTFVHKDEVGSIHFDRMRGEIFYKGHNIRHMELEEIQLQMLEKMRSTLKGDPKGRRFAESYERTLDKIIVEKDRALRSTP